MLFTENSDDPFEIMKNKFNMYFKLFELYESNEIVKKKLKINLRVRLDNVNILYIVETKLLNYSNKPPTAKEFHLVQIIIMIIIRVIHSQRILQNRK